MSSIYLAADASAASYTGSVASVVGFRYTLQVSITTDSSGRITDIVTSTPTAPTGQSLSIYSGAVPKLRTEGLTAQSANVSGVSGASYTTAAWSSSLASAISKIVIAPTPTPTPTLTASPQTQPATQPATTPPTNVAASTSTSTGTTNSSSPAPSNSACATMPPIKSTLPDVTSAPTPEGTPTPYGMPFPSGTPTVTSTGKIEHATTTQNYLQFAIQNMVKTVTKSELQTQIITCNYTATPTATPTVTVFVTVAPSPTDAPFVIKPGAGVVLKTFTCSKKVGNLTTKKVLKAKVIKCPTGYKLVKK